MNDNEPDTGSNLGQLITGLVPVKDVLKKITGPWATEIGLSFGDAARVYRLKNAVKLFRKVEKIAADANIELHPVAPHLLFPILDCATIQDDEELHTKWAILLTHAASENARSGVLPSFPEVLKQLASEDAKFLDLAYDGTQGDADEQKVPIPDEVLACANSVLIGNLERLGLVDRHMTDTGLDLSSTVKVHRFGPTNHLFVSAFGREFVRCCRIPTRTDSETTI